MPNGQIVNPLAALANTARQIGEQANNTLQGVGNSLTQATSQLLATAAKGPGLPGLPLRLPGIPGLGGGGGSTHRGNSNGFPAGLISAFTGIEDVVIPRGLPRPSQVLLGLGGPKKTAEVEEPAAPVPPAPAATVTPGVEGAQRPTELQRPSRALGIQSV